jgi:DUF2975 family protein
MSDTALHLADPCLASASYQGDLRARIGWICHALRIAAVLWITWNLAFVIFYWSDKAQILQNYGRIFSVDLGDVSAARYAAAFAAVMVSLAVGAVVVVCIWRLAGTYLAGRVFSVDAALWLRRTGLAGISAVIVSVLVRVAIAIILVGQFVPISPRGYFYLLPQDLLHAIFAVFVFALAHIFKAAAEMAEDQAQIV